MTERLDPPPLDPLQLDAQDSQHLAQVAVGRGSQLAEVSVERLITAGLIRLAPHRLPGAPALELTESGLARIRSSDQ